jgi:hypothetical protein
MAWPDEPDHREHPGLLPNSVSHLSRLSSTMWKSSYEKDSLVEDQ